NVDYEDGDDIAQLVMPFIDLSFEVFWVKGEDAVSQRVGMDYSELTKAPGIGGETVLFGQRVSVLTEVGDVEDGDSIDVDYKKETWKIEIPSMTTTRMKIMNIKLKTHGLRMLLIAV